MTDAPTAILSGEMIGSGFPGQPTDPRAYLLAFYPSLSVPPLDHVVLTAEPLVAEVHHGIWIARCGCGAKGLPAPGCVVWFSAMLAWCPRCQNAGTGRGWRRVTVPPADEIAAIEAILLCRPTIGDRNWTAGESIADLWAQNVEHSDPVPEAA